MPHYYDQKPVAASLPGQILARMHGHDFIFQTDSAVFSRHRLDFGSELLIETVMKEQGKLRGRILDLGCGYGPVGIILKRIFPSIEAVLCDINERALTLARHNARLNQIQYLEILQSDGMQNVPGDFDLVLTNPPIRAGKKVVYRFFHEAAAHLRPGGVLYVVIQKKQGAPSALKYLKSLFGFAEVAEHAAGYWIIRAGPIAATQDDVVE